jgi:hypothetical protein
MTNIKPQTVVYLILIIVVSIIIICMFKYSIGKKVATAKDKATEVSKEFTPKFIKYFFG